MGENEKELEAVKGKIRPLSAESEQDARKHWDNIAKPLSSLGKLEDVISRIAAIQHTSRPDISRPAVCVMCADNGVVSRGVTQTGSEVTAAVCKNMTTGNTTVCIMGSSIGADVIPVDIGINRRLDFEGVTDRKLMYGTDDIYVGAAMPREIAAKAVLTGISLVGELKEKGYNIILTGEMGIGNTTTSSAMASVMTGRSVEEVTGRGAGLTSEGLLRKIDVIKHAIEVNCPDREDALDVLSKLGGLDIAGMAGLYIGGAVYGVPVVIDGFISAVAALTAKMLVPESFGYMIPSHVSAEPAGKLMLDRLGVEPLITCGMCLGEGTGAVAAVSLLQMAQKVYYQMSSFDNVEFEKYERLK